MGMSYVVALGMGNGSKSKQDHNSCFVHGTPWKPSGRIKISLIHGHNKKVDQSLFLLYIRKTTVFLNDHFQFYFYNMKFIFLHMNLLFRSTPYRFKVKYSIVRC